MLFLLGFVVVLLVDLYFFKVNINILPKLLRNCIKCRIILFIVSKVGFYFLAVVFWIFYANKSHWKVKNYIIQLSSTRSFNWCKNFFKITHKNWYMKKRKNKHFSQGMHIFQNCFFLKYFLVDKLTIFYRKIGRKMILTLEAPGTR